ncbi:NAD(+) synthase [Tichowtungia aerotolerans]|uniref:NH(3)-dependent NAD(+) synthetase n=1 Tax=Tichowtungia aerotolerans TaxID=2697043 RepID=A0A6P1M7E0_9BACT|nr:NAD(+) synthase [Tichowtungia aerotolerans]QHI69771.1 NAD(+) synthase [Tichowtungia aerotolerans]
MNSKKPFSSECLRLDCEQEVEKTSKSLREILSRQFKKQGLIVALSGGIDSSVVGALCIRAVGKEQVFGLLLPEQDSSDATRRLGHQLVDHLGIATNETDITNILEAVGCYHHRDEAIRKVIPEYGAGYTCKILLPSLLDNDSYRLFSVAVQAPDGSTRTELLPPDAYAGILAASNFKQRVRKMLEYYHADRLNYAVAGTPNRLEYDQGFFVKLGDGAADVKPIAHLYKTQVYQLAEFLGIPEEIRKRPPTTDTYSMPQSQEEFYFSLPHDKMDLCLYGKNHGYSSEEVSAVCGLTAEQVQRVYQDIDHKRRSTRYLHTRPILIDPVPEV